MPRSIFVLDLALVYLLVVPGCEGPRMPTPNIAAVTEEEPEYTLRPGDPAEGEERPGDERPVEIDLRGNPKIGECELEREWFVGPNTYDFVYGSPELSLSPSGTLALRAGGGPDTFFRVNEGTWLGHDEWWAGAPDQAWSSRVRTTIDGDSGAVEMLDVATGEVLWSVPAFASPDSELGWLRALDALMSPDGQTVVQVACWSTVGQGGIVARTGTFDSNGMQVGKTIDVPNGCSDSGWPGKTRSAISQDGRFLVLTARGQGLIHAVDFETGATAHFDLTSPLEVEPVNGGWGYDWAEPRAVSVRPGDTEIAVAGFDARVRRLSLPNLELVGPPIQSALVSINQYSYGPTVESPVAWSPDGLLLAMLDPDGEAIVMDPATGEVAAFLPRPDVEAWPDWMGPDLFNPAVAFKFLPDQSGLLVSHEAGLTLWRCHGAKASKTTQQFSAQLSGSGELLSQEAGQWTATAGEVDHPVVFALYIDDQEGPAFTNLSGKFSFPFYDVGEHKLQVVADDGTTDFATTIWTVFVK